MKRVNRNVWLLIFAWALVFPASPAQAQVNGIENVDTLRVPGLTESVEIITDEWGIAHIYAQNEADLFFAQGYNAARDRLFQFEIWRRQTLGTVAEILGPRELKRDIGTRLFKFRGDMQQEMNHYHPRGELIITSYVDGVNAYIDHVLQNPEQLPLEFRLLGIQPGRWTPEVVISRHQGLLGNINAELAYGRAVALLGPERVKDIETFGPGEPELALDPAIEEELLFQDILELYNAYRRPVNFVPEDIVTAHRGDQESYQRLAAATEEMRERLQQEDRFDIGSNNWVVSGRLTADGFPIMANDPHRSLSVPSLRYMVHLIAPGWNVIGGGEPEIPGISIGHNEYGAWGLTVFATDAEDLYVYETNPANPNQYRYMDGWEEMRVITETIPVEGQDPVMVELKYTRHGPVVHEDEEHNKAYAVRAGWLEIGGSPYLASLRMDQARSWEEFREASTYSNIPGENMIWADRMGNIGWQAVGIAPIRRNWSGLVPVPGDGRYEWDGYLPIQDKPHIVNPEQGFWATANNNLIPQDYEYRDAVGWEWADPYRWARANEVLASGRRFNMMDMMKLQTDELSIPARTLVPLLEHVRAEDPETEDARQRLLDWDYVLDENSIPASIYVEWENRLRENIADLIIPHNAREYLGGLSMERTIEQLLSPDGHFGDDPVAGRNAFVLRSLDEAVDELQGRLGSDMDRWQYGQPENKHVLFRHPLSPALDSELRTRFEVGPLPRGGNSYTLNNTGGNLNQGSGATFRMIVPTGDWDRTVGTNAPGQAGDPSSEDYEDLFEIWATNQFFPVFYSREKIESVADEVRLLMPGAR